MENYDRFEQLLQQHSFKDLSAEELQLVMGFVKSEEEYESLRQAEMQLNANLLKQTALSPAANVWKRIKRSRAESSAKSPQYFWVNAPVPAYATFLLLIGVGVLGWYAGSNYSPSKVLVNQIQPRVDTVFIASKPDTVVREKIIYLNRQVMPPSVIQASVKHQHDNPTVKGVTMKEKEELEKLLVSGSI